MNVDEIESQLYENDNKQGLRTASAVGGRRARHLGNSDKCTRPLAAASAFAAE